MAVIYRDHKFKTLNVHVQASGGVAVNVNTARC